MKTRFNKIKCSILKKLQSRKSKAAVIVTTALILICTFIMYSYAYSYAVIYTASWSGNSTTRSIVVDLTGVDSASGGGGYCKADWQGGEWYSIAAPAGTVLYDKDVSGYFGYWTCVGGTLNGSFTAGQRCTLDMVNVDITATTPYIILPSVSKYGHSHTGWNVVARGSPYVYSTENGYSKKKDNGKVVEHVNGRYRIHVGQSSGIKEVKPTFSPWVHTLSYNANGGSNAPASATKTYGQALKISSAVPTKANYTFAGWNTSLDGSGTWYYPGDNYAHDQNGGTVTLYAQWNLQHYVDLNGTLNNSRIWGLNGVATVDLRIGSTWYRNIQDWNGYAPDGTTYEVTNIRTESGIVYTGNSVSGTVNGDVDINPDFKTIHTVDLNSYLDDTDYDRLAVGTCDVYVDNKLWADDTNDFYRTEIWWGSTVTLKDFKTNTGYSMTSSNPYVKTIYDTTDMRVKYKTNEYTLTFNPNGGTVSPASKKVKYKQTYGTLPSPERKHYTFTGWFNAQDGGNQVNESTVMNASDTTIYAHWKLNYRLKTRENWYNVGTRVTNNDMATLNTQSLYLDEVCSYNGIKLVYRGSELDTRIKVTKVEYPAVAGAPAKTEYSPTHLDTSVARSNVKVTYTILDSGNQYVLSKTEYIHIREIPTINVPTPDIYSRYIADKVLTDGQNAKNTLESNSKWNSDSAYRNKLNESYSKGINDYIRGIFDFLN